METAPNTTREPVIRVLGLKRPLVDELMQREGVTQVHLSNVWGCSQPSVSKMFKGDRGISFERLTQLAAMLRMRPETIAHLEVLGVGCPHCPHCQALESAA
jgi:predicted transcriptional regulator